ncbi:uracil-DNA glycosylase family protein [Microbulbifer magnicolonia]|uniref:uracil-DNA glycosylase family protein n=1 Tax=Microbulbifer magnicolonia TaxID=3109744 RepID=UPI002B417CE2|nr:uracil-DNA glycosylase family protein [Microbulbifer sp. GG15]
MTTDRLPALLEEIRSCRLCEASLPLGANPVVRATESARLLIIGQAPGTRVHASSIPWNDPSGDRLRDWLQLDRETFYDESRIAIVPMGFCYPGRGKGGDLPPRPECAATWHRRLLALLPNLQLTLLVGQYAQRHYLPHALFRNRGNITENVRHFRDGLPAGYFPLPHPSPRNTLWLRQRPWFEEEVVPELRRQVKKALR